MNRVTLTTSGKKSIKNFFDGVFGADNYDLDIGTSEVMESVHDAVFLRRDTFHKINLPNGGTQTLRLYAGSDYQVTEISEVY